MLNNTLPVAVTKEKTSTSVLRSMIPKALTVSVLVGVSLKAVVLLLP